MRAAVIGAGAMGSLATHLLIRGGLEVRLFEIREERRKLLESRGLCLRGVLEGKSRPTVLAPRGADAPFDVIVLAVKAFRTGEALRSLSPFVHRHTFYLSLQEGNAVEELVQLVGPERAWAALAWVSVDVAEDGTVEVEDCRSLVLGSPGAREEGKEPPALPALASALEKNFPGEVEVVGDIRPVIWRRLRSAAAVSALCALLGEKPDALRERGEAERWLREAAEECGRVAASLGLDLPLPEDPWKEAVWRRLPPPMLRDVEFGGVTEKDYLTGHVLWEAGRAGIKTPLLSALHSLLGEVERGERDPGERNIRELRRRVSEERGMSLM